MLYRLIIHDVLNEHVVVSLMGEGKYGPLLKERGIIVHSLNLKRRRLTFNPLVRLFFLIWHYRFYTVQTWMYHGDFIGGFVAYLCGVKNIFWGIHNTVLEPGRSTWSTIWLAKILAKVSWWMPTGIVVVSKRAIDAHQSFGYDASKMKFIPNGYDLSMFCPVAGAKAALQQEIGLDARLPIIGCVGRFDPYKDHGNLISALSLINAKNIEFVCVLVGRDITEHNEALYSMIVAQGLEKRVLLLGQRNDIPKIMNLIDIHVLSSSAEAFPNVVCEAMACGTPCVVTDVGDARSIVADTGWVVPSQDSVSLANGIEAALKELSSGNWAMRCQMSRFRIDQNFSIQEVVKMYNQLWDSCQVDQCRS